MFGTGSAPGDGVSTCNGYLWVFEDWLGACDWLVFGTGSAPADGVSTCNGYLLFVGVFEDWLVIGKVFGKSQ